ncbi:MAG: aldo/keto reductase [Alphaproteobacteria bacterium]|nr:aldo/keto reductase [Alphaproteobacteria bacterium]
MKNNNIPKVGLGTYGLTGDNGTQAIITAIKNGYRHIDTAQTYDTEKQVGFAVRDCGLARDQLFITTKITPENFSNLKQSLSDSLAKLGTDRVNLTLIHWPSHYDKVPISDYIGELAQVQDEGLTDLIGVSNFTRRHLDEVDKEIGIKRLSTNQFECHAYLQNRILAQYCIDADVAVTCYMPMAVGAVLKDPVIIKIAQQHNCDPSQVALAYLLQQGYIVIPKSANAERQKTNLASTDVNLTADNMSAIDALDRGQRIVDPEWGPTWD